LLNNLINLPLESALLNGLLRHSVDGLAEVDDIVSAADFSSLLNQKVYTVFKYLMYDKKCYTLDLPTVNIAAQDLGFKDITNEYLNKLYNHANIAIPNLRPAAFGIRRLSFARKTEEELNSSLVDMKGITSDSKFSDIMNIVEKRLFQLSSSLVHDSEIRSIGHGVDEYIEELISNPKDIAGIPTGFQRWDKAIGGGLRPGSINVIGARAKVGKSFLALNMATNVSKFGIPVLYLDTELTKKQQLDRQLSLLSGVNIELIETGKFVNSPPMHDAIKEAAKTIKDLFDYESVTSDDISKMLSLIRRWLITKVGFNASGTAKPCLIIYDFIKVDNSDVNWQKTNEYQNLGHMMSELVVFAKQYDVSFLVMSQLNRDAIDKEASENQIAGSDRIAWFCGSFSIMAKKNKNDLDNDPFDNGDRKIIPVLARFGQGLLYGDYINIQSDLAKSRMTEGIQYAEAINPTNYH